MMLPSNMFGYFMFVIRKIWHSRLVVQIVQFCNIINYSVKKKANSNIVSISPDYARNQLEHVCPNSNGSCICNNNICCNYQYDLQIIIPCYNVQEYIEDCIQSVLNQKTKYSYCIYIINDGSNDDTAQIIKKYSNISNIKIINQENKGLSGARNSGLKTIIGKYIMFIDSDDMLFTNSIDRFLDVAYKYNADAVIGSYVESYNNRLEKVTNYSKLEKIKSETSLVGTAWAKVFKNDIFKNIQFPEGYLYEDSLVSFIIAYKCKRVYRIPDITYVYRMNPRGITNSSKNNYKAVDTFWITEKMINEHKSLMYTEDNYYYDKVLRQMVINQKRVSALSEEIQEYGLVLISDIIKNKMPDLFGNKIIKKQYNDLVYSLVNNDFGLFSLYCKYH